ncbi:hypothetical protein K439DRAFT_389700 [Ramaria rubella]|nr:hypothetical protein K439DRAFT_389700 [Ramaria rubella]
MGGTLKRKNLTSDDLMRQLEDSRMERKRMRTDVSSVDESEDGSVDPADFKEDEAEDYAVASRMQLGRSDHSSASSSEAESSGHDPDVHPHSA